MLICTFMSTGNMIEVKQLCRGSLGLMLGTGHGISSKWLTVWTYVLQPRGGAEGDTGASSQGDQGWRGTTGRCRCDQFIFATEQNWPVILSPALLNVFRAHRLLPHTGLLIIMLGASI